MTITGIHHPFAQRSVAVLVAALLAATLSSCAADAAPSSLGDYPDISLAQSKSPVQLLRNEVASRVPADVVTSVPTSKDASVACLPAEEDAEGRIRSWQSTMELRLADDSAATVDAIVDELAATFVDQGWNLATSGNSALVNVRTLSRGTDAAGIEIGAVTDDPDAIYGEKTIAEDVSITITVHGPCVVTDGERSDEVKKLERS